MAKIGKMNFISILVLVFVSVLTTHKASAANPVELKLEVDPEEVAPGQLVRALVQLQSTKDFNVDEVSRPTEVSGLQFLKVEASFKGQSTQAQITSSGIEYHSTYTQQIVYTFKAEKAQRAIIPSFKITVDGKTYSTPEKRINISDSAATSRSQGRGRPQFFDDESVDDDPLAIIMRQRQKMLEELEKQLGGSAPGGSRGFNNQGFGQNIPSRKLDINMKEAFVVVLEVDKKSAYEGEQVTARWYLYTKDDVVGLDRAKFPDLKGFWKEIIEEVPTIQFTPEYVNGVLYRKALLASHALFPIKSSVPAIIDPFLIKAKIQSRSMAGQIIVNEYTKSSLRQVIQVLPLPTEGKPLSFSGAVGLFNIQAQVDGQSFPMGQPLSLKIRFDGQGNAKTIDLPPIAWPQDVEIYDTKSDSKFYPNGQSYKEFEVLLIPKKQGELKIPAISFSYFDPELKQYITKTSEEIVLRITEPVAGQAAPLSAQAKSDDLSKTKIEKIEPLLPVVEWYSGYSWIENRLAVLVFSAVFVVLLLLAEFVIKWRNLNFKLNPRDKVERRWRQIDKAHQKKNEKAVAVEATNLIYDLVSFLSMKIDKDEDLHLTLQQAPQIWREQFENRIISLFDYYQMVGFAPESIQKQALVQKPLSDSVIELKKLTEDILSALPKE